MRTTGTILSGVLSIAALTAAANASVSTLTPDFGSYTAGDGAMGTVTSSGVDSTSYVKAGISTFYIWTTEYRAAIEIGIGSIPTSATVNTATLQFSLDNYSDPNHSHSNLAIYGYTADGTITGADYNHKTGTPLITIDASGNSSKVYSVDVTSFIQSLVSTGKQYAGFLAVDTGDGSPNSFYIFADSYGNSYNNDCGPDQPTGPRLVVDWTDNVGQPPVPEPASLAILALPAGAMLMKRRK